MHECSLQVYKRDLQINNQRITAYEGELFNLTCSITNQDTSESGQPRLLIEPALIADSTYQWPTPVLNITRPNNYTVHSQVNATAAFNENSVRCQNTTEKKSSTDQIFFIDVLFLHIKPEMTKKVFRFDGKNTDEERVECNEYLVSNHDIDYRWEGEIVNNYHRNQFIVIFSSDEQQGMHNITCVASLQGDPTPGLNTRRIDFTVVFPELLGGNRNTAPSLTLPIMYTPLYACLLLLVREGNSHG